MRFDLLVELATDCLLPLGFLKLGLQLRQFDCFFIDVVDLG
jgi:hypothetical protein